MDQVIKAEEKRYAELQLLALNFARMGQTTELKMMLEHGLAVNLADSKDQTLLMLASYNGHFDCTQMLIQKGADLNRPNMRGLTPFAGVAFKGYLNILELMYDSGADYKALNRGGMSALDFARLFGQKHIVSYLELKTNNIKTSAFRKIFFKATSYIAIPFRKLLLKFS